jgi:hypothetical protein
LKPSFLSPTIDGASCAGQNQTARSWRDVWHSLGLRSRTMVLAVEASAHQDRCGVDGSQLAEQVLPHVKQTASNVTGIIVNIAPSLLGGHHSTARSRAKQGQRTCGKRSACPYVRPLLCCYRLLGRAEEATNLPELGRPRGLLEDEAGNPRTR